MAGTSDSKQPDDVRLHLETIIEADDALADAPEGETEEERALRESLKLRPGLRKRLDSVYGQVLAQAPGLTAAETRKLLTTQEGRQALDAGKAALARVDSHLQSVTGERNPIIGKKYGVYGENPRTFAGVFRALELSVGENAAVAALPEEDPERERRFTPVIQREVEKARDDLARMLAARIGTRADFSQAVTVKGETMSEAQAVISAVREHLYANLPNRKWDDRLRNYGFRPLKPGRRKAGPPPDTAPETSAEGTPPPETAAEQ